MVVCESATIHCRELLETSFELGKGSATRKRCVPFFVASETPMAICEMTQALLDYKDVCNFLKIGEATLTRMLRDKQFPEPIRLRGCSRWRLADIERHLDQLAGSGVSE